MSKWQLSLTQWRNFHQLSNISMSVNGNCLFYAQDENTQNTYEAGCKSTLYKTDKISNIDTLTHWGRVTHISVGKITIIGSDNGSSPARRQAIIWTNAGILLIGPLGTNFSDILIGIQTFSFTKNALENVVCEMASILSRPQCVNSWWHHLS